MTHLGFIEILISLGSPSPNGIKSDIKILIQYIRHRNPSKIIVHGESIGIRLVNMF